MPKYQIFFQNGQAFPVRGFSLLGRNPDSRIMNTAQLLILEDPTKTVSKTHAALAINQYGQLMIEDLDSTNGTYITRANSHTEIQINNGEPQAIAQGDRVRIGEVLFGIKEY